jgi:hypothetical protein
MDFVTGNGPGAGADRLYAAIEEGMAGASAMPDLEEDATIGGMDGIGHLLPGRGMGRGVDARLRPEGRVPGHGHGRLGNQQAGARPLGIVFGHQGVGEVFLTRPAAGERRHEDPVGGGDGANAQWSEEIRHNDIQPSGWEDKKKARFGPQLGAAISFSIQGSGPAWPARPTAALQDSLGLPLFPTDPANAP